MVMDLRSFPLIASVLTLVAAAPAWGADPFGAAKPADPVALVSGPPPIVMKLATVAPDRTPWSELLKKYKANVEAKSGGRIVVKVFLGGQLGDENESVNKCKRGQIQAVGASTGALASQVPELNAVELPFLFRDAAEADKVIDKIVTPAMDKIFPKYGLVMGFWSENGFRQFGTKDKAVHAPGDLGGKKMRSQESPVHQEMWRTLGAQPAPIPSTEALTALETGTVDGFDQATLFTVAASWHKTVKYFTISNHIYQPAIIVYNQKWFMGLPPDLQKVVIDEGRAMQDKGRAAVRKIHGDLLKIMEAAGVTISELTPAERAVFEATTASVRKFLRTRQAGDDTPKLMDAIEAELKALRGGK